jgi:hypothetical protein
VVYHGTLHGGKLDLYKKYAGNLGYVCKSIWFDVGHGVTRDEVIAFF